jgi:hypothetical protein
VNLQGIDYSILTDFRATLHLSLRTHCNTKEYSLVKLVIRKKESLPFTILRSLIS